jgi:hypothetical protein
MFEGGAFFKLFLKFLGKKSSGQFIKISEDMGAEKIKKLVEELPQTKFGFISAVYEGMEDEGGGRREEGGGRRRKEEEGREE